jgi:protein-S-isoprenylcysteine O-methyltransferase Ste14
MHLSKPAMLAAISYLIMAFIIILPFDIGNYDSKYEKTKEYNFSYRVLLLIIMLIPIGLSIYSINCFVIGKCVVWGYINAIIIALWVMLFVMAALLSSSSNKN